MTPEGTLALKERAAKSQRFNHIQVPSSGPMELHCVSCNVGINQDLGVGLWCNDCWFKLTEGLE